MYIEFMFYTEAQREVMKAERERWVKECHVKQACKTQAFNKSILQHMRLTHKVNQLKFTLKHEGFALSQDAKRIMKIERDVEIRQKNAAR